MPAEIVRFAEDHIAAAAGLITAYYGRLVALEPCLPEDWLNRPARVEDIATALRTGLGVAAITGNELLGFLIARLDLGGPVPEFGWPSAVSLGGARGAVIRVGAHAAAGPDAAAVYRSMYAALAADLVDEGCFRHSVAVAVCDGVAVNAWFGLGFGIDQIRGSRDLAPLDRARPDIAVRRAEPEDIEVVLRLSIEGLRYHATSPIFQPPYFALQPVRRDLAEAMRDPERALWVGVRDREIVGVMEITGFKRASVNSARSQTAFTIGMAAVAGTARSSGVGSAIFTGVVDWARGEGCDRCTVEWTSANQISDRFWRKCGFRPVQYVLTRHIDERVLAAL